MKGIENLKKVVTWCTELVDEIFNLIEKKQGKKITGFVALKFLDNLFALFPILQNYKEIGAEWVDLDEQEKADIKALVKFQLDIKDDFSEELAERLFYIIIELGDFIAFVVEAKK
tara:strand:+ start:1441 stop:1785 length:345 start_codon:yes stop_codon:yes gene_type:complete